MEKKKLENKGIHDVLDSDLDNSYVFSEGNKVIGYACYRILENKSIWMDLILAAKRGEGKGADILNFLFKSGIEEIEGTAIYGPHFFWGNVGSEFSKEVEEDIYDGTYFVLRKENFNYHQ